MKRRLLSPKRAKLNEAMPDPWGKWARRNLAKGSWNVGDDGSSSDDLRFRAMDGFA